MDRQRRQRYQCPHCQTIFNRRTRTLKSGSRLTDTQWNQALQLFCTRGGMSAADMARLLHINRKTAQRLNRCFRAAVASLTPPPLSGVSEGDEAVPLCGQWVIGGVSRKTRQCLLRCIPHRSALQLSGFVNTYSDPESFVCTDEHLGYSGVTNRFTVCHRTEFVNRCAPFVHTNRIEGIWGHLKPLGKHVYRGFPRQTLPMFLFEFMFRYNVRSYQTRVAVLSALLTRKTNSHLV
jgi:hypothetical protein